MTKILYEHICEDCLELLEDCTCDIEDDVPELYPEDL